MRTWSIESNAKSGAASIASSSHGTFQPVTPANRERTSARTAAASRWSTSPAAPRNPIDAFASPGSRPDRSEETSPPGARCMRNQSSRSGAAGVVNHAW